MKEKLLLLTLPLLFVSCGMSFNYNGLQCPTNDMTTINEDLAECRLYDIKDVEKSFSKDPECKACLEDKGYTIDPLDNDSDAKQ